MANFKLFGTAVFSLKMFYILMCSAVYGGPFPKADFQLQMHIASPRAK